MAAETGPDSALAQLNLTPDENRIFRQLFRQADADNVGVVTGEVAVPFFERTRLDSRVLGEIWRIADKENRGFLTYGGFAVVLRLIGHAQAGRQPTTELAMQHGQPPRFDGFTPVQPVPTAVSPTGGNNNINNAGPGLAAQQTGGPNRFPALTPDRVAQYTTLFERQPLQDGMLPGEQARQLFVKSSLSGDVLRKIWELADTEQRGSLALTEFVIAMHLLSSIKSGALRSLPNVLPAALYEAATRRGPAAPMPAIPRQLTGPGSGTQPRTGSPLGRPPIGPYHQQQLPQSPPRQRQQQQIQQQQIQQHVQQQSGGGDWLITPQDKARFDQIYDSLDKNGKGFIAGDEAVDFMRQSNLPEGTLAVIWDLSDINADGALNRDEFAVAMYLIRQQRSGSPGSVPMPTTLPPNLVPPSMRAPPPPAAQRPQTASSVFDAPAPQSTAAPPLPPSQPPQSVMDDLFGLETASSPTSPHPPAAQMQVPLSTGGSASQDPFAGGGAVAALRTGSPPPRPSPTSSFRPFVPASLFGRGLTAQTTGDSKGAGAVPMADDLLGDPDPEVSKRLTNETTELANLSNQVGSLSKQMLEVQAQRGTTQNDLNQTTLQKKNFEQRLAQLRTMYEKEAADARALSEQLNNARRETQKLQSECLGLEGKYKDAQQERQQLVSALQADQQENASLRERIRTVSNETAQLKAQVERLKSEARQQKGLVAINKKQLSTGEAERDRLRNEAEDLASSRGSQQQQQQQQQLEELNRTSSPASSARDYHQVASPAASVNSANNPFFRRTASTDIVGAFATPPKSSSSTSGADRTLDDVFGPTFPRAGSTGTPTPPPLTSFMQQHTGASASSVGSGTAFAMPPTSLAGPAVQAAEPAAADGAGSAGSAAAPPFFVSPFADLADRARYSGTPGASSERLATPLGGSRAPSPATARSADATPGRAAAAASPLAPATIPETMTPPPAATATTTMSTTTAEPESFADAADSAKAKADFDNAFASFTKAKKSSSSSPSSSSQDVPSSGEPTKSMAAFNTEFPPIRELEGDSDDDSDSTASERGGFDDDFAPAVEAAGGADAGVGSESQRRPRTPASQGVDPFGSPTPKNQSQTTTTTTTTTAASIDDEFDGLEDAQEGSPDDDFANISRSGFDDFNPVFDSGSPPPSQPSQARSDSHAAAFGADSTSSFDFAAIPSDAAAADGGAVAGGKKTDSQEWDAIFADLDAPEHAAGAAGAGAGVADDTAVLAEEPDDPMVKNLTGMGYSRPDAVAALEKHDYNLNLAANYLASQS